MSKSDSWEEAILRLLFNATPIANVADDAAAAPLTEIFVALHTANPGEGGNQGTSEIAYTGYARIGVARTAGGWVVTGNSVSPAATIEFPTAQAGTPTPVATHASFGRAGSGATPYFYYGALSPNIAIQEALTPRITPGSTIAED